MKDEIKEYVTPTLEYLRECVEDDIIFETSNCKALLDYITNLQEKSNNQSEEINRLYKQREKFMKKYGYLKEENERCKKAIEYMNNYIKVEESNEPVKIEFKVVRNILQGEDKNE